MNNIPELESLYDVVTYEIKEQKTSQEEISLKLQKNNGNMWRVFQKGNTKFSILLKILNLLNFEVRLTHRKSGKTYLIKNP